MKENISLIDRLFTKSNWALASLASYWLLTQHEWAVEPSTFLLIGISIILPFILIYTLYAFSFAAIAIYGMVSMALDKEVLPGLLVFLAPLLPLIIFDITMIYIIVAAWYIGLAICYLFLAQIGN